MEQQSKVDKVFKPQGNLRKAVAVFLIIIYGGCCLFQYFSFISFPSTEVIARQYLNAVVREDLNGATSWVDKECRQVARESAQQDIDQFGNSEVRNVAVEVGYGSGSDDQFQYARVTFEYRKRGEANWQYGQMRILTDHAVPGFRYTCGNIFSGP